MGLSAFVLTGLLSAVPQPDAGLACTFPAMAGQDQAQIPLTVNVEHTPSLFDRGTNFQVQLTLSSVGDFDAAAGPEKAGSHWDVIIRGIRERDRVAVGLKADGTAMLKIAAASGENQTRFGRCEGYEGYLQRWTD